jgi:hypothetical protein
MQIPATAKIRQIISVDHCPENWSASLHNQTQPPRLLKRAAGEVLDLRTRRSIDVVSTGDRSGIGEARIKEE